MLDIAEFQRQLPDHVRLKEYKPLASGTPIHATTLFPSRKNARSVSCASDLQTQACLYFEQDRSITAYLTRPFSLRTSRLKTPSLIDALTFNDDGGYSLYLLSRAPWNQTSSTSRQMDSIEIELNQLAVKTIRFDIAHFASESKLRNLRYLYHHAYNGHIAGATAVQSLLGDLPGEGATIERLVGRGAQTCHIAYALFYEMISANLERPLSSLTYCQAFQHAPA